MTLVQKLEFAFDFLKVILTYLFLVGFLVPVIFKFGFQIIVISLQSLHSRHVVSTHIFQTVNSFIQVVYLLLVFFLLFSLNP